MGNKFRLLVSLFSVLVAVAIAGCSGGSSEVPSTPVPAEVRTSCPAAGDQDAGTNTEITATYGTTINPSGVTQSTLKLTCGGASVAGQLTVEGDTLRFVAAAPLPRAANCTVQVSGAGLSTTAGNPISNASWTFTTGDGEKRDWRFSEPNLVSSSDDSYLYLRKVIYANDFPVVIFKDGYLPQVFVTHSYDSGQTFVTSAPPAWGPRGSATIEEFDAKYSGGRLHMTWRLLPFGVRESELLYSHSTIDLATFSEPIYLSGPADGLHDFDPAISVNGDDVWIAWQQACNSYGCGDTNVGVHLTQFSAGGDILVTSNQLTTGDESSPDLATFSGQLLMAWIKADVNFAHFAAEIIDHANGDNVLSALSSTGEQIWPQSFSLNKLDEGHGVLHWQEGSGPGDRTFFVADIDADAKIVDPARLLLSAPADQYRYNCSEMHSDDTNGLVWTSALGLREDVPFGSTVPTTRTVKFTHDGAHSFEESVPLNFMLPYIYVASDDQVYDDFCPMVASRNGNELFVSWVRYGGGHRTSVFTSVGRPQRPCSR